MNFLDKIWLIPLFPAAGFVINGLFGKKLPKALVGSLAAGLVLLSFVFAAGAVSELAQREPEHRSHTVNVYEWINTSAGLSAAPEAADSTEKVPSGLVVQWGFLLDPLSSVMVLFVTGIGFLIHVYSVGYMWEEDGFYRFFAYLNLFMFSMLTLILVSNYLMKFIGWEGVGLCSYLLIGYYFLKKSAGDAAK
jgi:NADH-quinone oxidoreductase subunit L